MIRFVWFLLAAAVCMMSCTPSAQHAQLLSDAERIVLVDPDSALSIIGGIEMSDLDEDAHKTLYSIILASAHKAKESPMASDSLVGFALEYYRSRDFDRFIQSGDLYALHRFWIGDGKGALELLDSMLALPGVTDSLRIQLLRSRIGVGGAEFDCSRNIECIKWLQALDRDPARQVEYKYQLCENYQFAGYSDSALTIVDELIDYARRNHLGDDHFKYAYEKIGILEEAGRYDESNTQVDYILEHAPHNSAIPYLRFWKALNYFNKGDYAQSSRELAIADSCAEGREDVDNGYYESFAGHLREFLKYERSGIIRLGQLATLNNTQRDRFSRMESTRLETEQAALRLENRALTLKARSQRQTAIIIIVTLMAIIVALVAVWNIQKRKRRIMDAEERAEALQKMVEELKTPTVPPTAQDALRRAMLQQLGIIKMVAETPTEQNREMLRKISSIDGETNGSLVNWNRVYEMIDNLYAGFYGRLHDRYGDTLTDKEEQIIVLMVARFSTKEIGVITAQTTATIYVRKSSVRKKLGVPEKEDIVAFLNHGALA